METKIARKILGGTQVALKILMIISLVKHWKLDVNQYCQILEVVCHYCELAVVK